MLESTGTVVIEYNWRTHVFIYDNTITKYIAGDYNNRSLWHVFLSDMVADSNDVKQLQEALMMLANDRDSSKISMPVILKTPRGEKHWFRMNVYKQTDDFGLAEKMIITFNDVHEEVAANDKLLYQATHDELTGLYNRSGFIARATEMIAEKEAGYYVISTVDINKFKVINDQYGTSRGDEVLRRFADVLRTMHDLKDSIFCRVMADCFAILYPQSLIDTPELSASHHALEVLDETLPPLSIAIGRCLINDRSLDVSAYYDRALLAKQTVKGRYDAYIATYDESMRTSLLRQQEITGQMKQALAEGQFEVWLQAQFNHSTGLLSGAEALVRWRHPKEGVISPGEFIPIFEKNGFVYEVDKFVWEKTCQYLREWLDRGLNPVPVSVNISRYNVFRSDLTDVITGLVRKYDLPVDLLRLEITESAFAESAEQIITVVKQFIKYGFIVEIDDFGSGYSSLNTLKDVPAQVLKMDMRFLENDTNAQRGGSIIESVIRMAKWLGMTVIAEGVETVEQADYLKSIGCEYVQGFLYSKPSQLSEYEKFFMDGEIESTLNRLHTVETWNNNAFWNPVSMETLIFNSYVGGACIFEYNNGRAELLRYNAEYARIFGRTSEFNYSDAHKNILVVLDAANADRLRNCITAAIKTKSEASCELNIANRANTAVMYFNATIRQIAEAGERRLFYCVVNDTTEQRMAERKQLESARQLETVMNNVNGGVSAVCMRGGKPEYLIVNDRYYDIIGYTKEQFKAEVNNVFDRIVPEDRERVNKLFTDAFENKGQYSMEYRFVRRDGSVRNILCNTNVISLIGIDEPVQLAVSTDITELREAQQQERNLSTQKNALMKHIRGGITATVLHESGNVELVFANDGFYELYGYTRAQWEAEVSDMTAPILPEDLEKTMTTVARIARTRECETYEYRCRKRDGSIMWTQATNTVISLDGVGDTVLLALSTDITAQKNAIEQLRYLSDTAHDIFIQADTDKAIRETLKKLVSYHQADRGYVIELNYVSMVTQCAYEVCADGVNSRKESLRELPFNRDDLRHKSLTDGNIIRAGNSVLPGGVKGCTEAMLAARDVNTAIIVPLFTDGILTGFLGLDNPRVNLKKSERLSPMGDYISILLGRRNVEDARRELLDNLPVGTALLEYDGSSISVIHISKRYWELVKRSPVNFSSTSVFDKFHPDDIKLVHDEISAAIKQCRIGSVDARLACGRNGYTTFRITATITPEANGKYLFYVYYTPISTDD